MNETPRGERESGSYSGTRLRNRNSRALVVRQGNLNGPGDAGGSPGKSFLFCMSGRDPGILSQGDRVLTAKSTAFAAVSGESRADLENPGEGYVEVSHRFVPISAAGLQGEKPLVDRLM